METKQNRNNTINDETKTSALSNKSELTGNYAGHAMYENKAVLKSEK